MLGTHSSHIARPSFRVTITCEDSRIYFVQFTHASILVVCSDTFIVQRVHTETFEAFRSVDVYLVLVVHMENSSNLPCLGARMVRPTGTAA
eukprot:27813-Prorocentrum_minimum.AAC.2